ncbi:MAG: ABC transporter permease, partial [Ignavibacteria bacterium]
NAFGSALQSGNSIVADIDSGFLQKMLVTPVSRSAILLGRLSSDAFRVVVQTAIILALAYILGAVENDPFTVKTGVVGVLLIFFTLAFFGLAWSGISLALGMKTRSAETVFAIGGVITFPLLFLSSALFPISFLPTWVKDVSMFNPVSYAVDASRALMITGYDWGTILPAWGVIGLVAIITLSATLYQFRKVVS